ncbi:protein SAWADEE HOMEODOMAIN HOMOLOG 1-like [Lotus japonicus]|uniref:protein SAWADEE HOMEODOMAIN HOMOLOG 1-like n=1 Tax=Lotus japonicus TaxID=34305 RepID=UPI00258A89D8|nr:protein SAWADEE HOMEODOMAIN HOMOLOG 1-like [Lotus japonicus]
MVELSLIDSPFPKLSTDQMLELERIYNDMGENAFDQNLCQEIAATLSAANTSISWEQVQQWFQNKLHESQDRAASLNQLVDISDTPSLRSSTVLQGNRGAVVSDLAFEARSTKDLAWHDVSMLLNYRVLSTGELEARVRYAGFGKGEDEWVNVKYGVRDRSIPLEPSECHKVKDGDLVLCFLERDDYALYCDARVLSIQRKQHDETDCKCIYTVRFLHDNSEEAIHWKRVCYRPTQEESVVYHNSPEPTIEPSMSAIENLWG